MTKSRLRTRARRRVRAVLLRLLASILGLLPLGAALWLGRASGGLAHLLARKERKRARRHLRIAFPELDDEAIHRICRECFVNLGEHLLEICVVRRRGPLVDELVVTDPEDIAPLDEALAEGKGCLVVSGHIGSWELAAQALSRRGYEVVAVARRFHDPGLGALVEGFRESGGVVTLPRGAPGTVRRLLGQLRKGGMIFMLVDQDTKVPSLFVPFFGRLAKTPRGPADLALRAGVEVVMGFIHREGRGGRHRLRAERLPLPEPTGDRDADARSLLEAVNRRIEAEIRKYPAEWVWFHERWRSRPEEPAPEDRRDAAGAS